ncbi:MAG: hypothetical protein V8S98_07260 [Lachnospiraceae bacterium]
MGELESSADLLSISSTIQKLLTHRIKKNYLDYLDCSEAISEYSMTVPRSTGLIFTQPPATG